MRFAACGPFLLLLSSFLPCSLQAFVPKPPDTLVLRAMESELKRSMDSLRLPGQKRPYFLSYLLWDMQGYRVEASMGALEKAAPEPMRMLDVDLRIGDYKRDQTLFEGGMVFGPRLRAPVPESGDTLLLRQALWALTDARYKVALEQLAQKKSFLESRHQPAPPPDWSRQKVLRRQMDIDPLHPPDTAGWMAQCRKLSAEAGKHAWLADSRVSFQYYYITFYYVDSEGASFIQSLQENAFLAALLCQAEDGTPLWEYLRVAARDSLLPRAATGLGSFAALRDSLAVLARRLNALRKAPAPELYRGPVLLTGPAAGEVIHRSLLQPQARLRQPLSESSEPSFLLGLAGRKYFPGFFSIRDLPSKDRHEGRRLFGAYRFDHQGQPAEDLVLVRGGRLQDFYRGKTPLQAGHHRSNGHWRYGGGFPGVVEVQASPALSEKALLDSLRVLSRDEGAPYGLRISKLADEDAWKLLRHPLAQNLPFSDPAGGRGSFALPAPVAVDAVDAATGALTPLRGLVLNSVDSKSLRDITAAGDAPHLLEPQASFSLLCPSLLFTLLDLRGSRQVQPRLPLLP